MQCTTVFNLTSRRGSNAHAYSHLLYTTTSKKAIKKACQVFYVLNSLHIVKQNVGVLVRLPYQKGGGTYSDIGDTSKKSLIKQTSKPALTMWCNASSHVERI